MRYAEGSWAEARVEKTIEIKINKDTKNTTTNFILDMTDFSSLQMSNAKIPIPN
jgi:hypothetical protein